jgi:hypothetical protein
MMYLELRLFTHLVQRGIQFEQAGKGKLERMFVRAFAARTRG